MKKIYILLLFSLVTIFAIADIMSDNGIAGKTGSPGENNCTGCHTSFAVNSGAGAVTIASPNLTNWEYVPGQMYQINVTVAQTGAPLFGFGFEALRTSNNSNGGTLQISSSTTTQLKTANINGTNRTSVVHKQNAGLTSNSHTFSFNWMAPTTNIGNVMFYVAGNACDNQGDSLNDYVYITSQLVTPLSSGFAEAGYAEKLDVFPNPVHDVIKIRFPYNSDLCHFQLFNMEGVLVLNEEIINSSADNIITLQLPHKISNGVYFLKTESDLNSFGTKVIVFN